MNSYDIPYSLASDVARSPAGLMSELVQRALYIDRIVRRDQINILAGISGISLVLSSRLRNRPLFVFTDTEDTGFASRIVFPLSKRIITPHCFAKDLGMKHVRYRGYQELAYLHPKYFKPDSSLLDQEGISKDEPFVFLRFTSFAASHDIAQHGLSIDEKIKLVDSLSERYPVVISSESKMPSRFEKYRFRGSPKDVHHYLYYAKLFFGDSQTMATEAGLLGTPAIRCNTLAGSMHGLGNFRELERDYGLVYSFRDFTKAFLKLNEFLNMDELEELWVTRRNTMLANMDDVVMFVSRYFETKATMI
jgi:predicted glycosyltransferase